MYGTYDIQGRRGYAANCDFLRVILKEEKNQLQPTNRRRTTYQGPIISLVGLGEREAQSNNEDNKSEAGENKVSRSLLVSQNQMRNVLIGPHGSFSIGQSCITIIGS